MKYTSLNKFVSVTSCPKAEDTKQDIEQNLLYFPTILLLVELKPFVD